MHAIQSKIFQLASEGKLKNVSYRTLGEMVGIGRDNPQKVKHHLDQLIKRNLIYIDRDTKNIYPVRQGFNEASSLIAVPIYGRANCGEATLFADDHIEGYLEVSPSMIPSSNKEKVFALKAVGYSMNNAKVSGKTSIDDGDYVLIDPKKSNPENGKYYLSILGGLANIKRFYKDVKNSQILLMSESTKDYPPIAIHPEDIDSYQINGEVIQVIKNPRNFL